MFIQFVDVVNRDKKILQMKEFEFQFWKSFKRFCRKYLKVKAIVGSFCFDLVMFLVIMCNAGNKKLKKQTNKFLWPKKLKKSPIFDF